MGILDCFSDSNHGGNLKDGRSTSSILCLCTGGAIAWASRKQMAVAISTTEAEIVAASETACEIVWLTKVYIEIAIIKQIPIIKVDSDAAVRLARELHRRTKHIATRHVYVRELIADGKLQVKHVGASLQNADFLTKPLSRPLMVSIMHRRGLGCYCFFFS